LDIKNNHACFDILRILLHFGADVLQPDGDGSNTALHICAAQKQMNLKTLYILFQAGAYAALKVPNARGLLPVQVRSYETFFDSYADVLAFFFLFTTFIPCL